MRKWLFALGILYFTYSSNWPLETGIPGLNVANLLFLTLIATTFFARDNPPERGWPPLATPILAFSICLVVAFAYAQITMPLDLRYDISYLRDALFYPLLYFVFRNCRMDAKDTRFLVIAVMAVSALAALQAVRQGLDYGIGKFQETHRAAGPFGSNYTMSNRAGIFYASMLPMFVAIASYFPSKSIWRWAGVAGIGLLVFAILVTYSRQAYFIALLASLLVLVRRPGVAILMIALALPAMQFIPESATERVQETRQQDTQGNEKVDDSTSSRWEIWGQASRMWVDHPMGVGLARFRQYIGNYGQHKNKDAHNMYVLIYSEVGPFGLLCLLWLIFAMWRVTQRLKRSLLPGDAEGQALAVGSATMVIAFALGNVYGSPFFEGPVVANLWILLGLLEHYGTLSRRAAHEHGQNENQQVRMPSLEERFPLFARSK